MWNRTCWCNHRLDVLCGARFESVVGIFFLREVFNFPSIPPGKCRFSTRTCTSKYLTVHLSPRIWVRTAKSEWWLTLTRGRNFSSIPIVQTGSDMPQSPIHCVGVFSRVKMASTRSLPLSSTLPCTGHIKNGWSYTSTSSICLHAADKVKFAFTLHEASYYWHYELYTELYPDWRFSVLFLSCKANARV